ncbi:MAG: hypothetical protein EPN79_11805 [Burkholderiaceae bacterium]|nr:MAG: hypothetical protein EPN79_11805 [Burkholderiaceae bacterium]TBR76658.1 MAG: hypothetical protein EPN64_05260 [Burkholderiaceae bacterium]
MANDKPRGPGYERIHLIQDDVLERLVSQFMNRSPLAWPVVSARKVHQIWSQFIDTGRVSDEMRLQEVLDTMLQSLAHLRIANIVSGHEQQSPESLLEDRLPADRIEEFCDWLIDEDSGHWRISDYGVGPLTDAIALAFETRTPEERLKYMDRALHVTHMRGDLSSLFIEGGRVAMIEIDCLVPGDDATDECSGRGITSDKP